MRIIGNNPAAENAEITAIASGTLPSGQPVVVNADGTVSVVAETSASQDVGSAAVFLSGAMASSPAAAFDSNSDRVVIAYQGPNPYSGFAVVGTISGTSISFGTPVVFKTNSGNISMAFDSSNNKIVIAYRFGDDLKGYAIVGTVSGTTISFGTPVEFEAGNMTGSTSAFVSSNKVVISYRDAGNSSYGTSIVGTVSGTGISFGTAVVFESASTGTGATDMPSSANITGTDKVVIAYKDVGNSNRGTSIVGTVSGTSISFGTAVVFDTYVAVSYMAVAFDSNADRAVICWQDASTNYGAAIVGTVSGTAISFGTKVVFEEAQTDNISATFDSNANKVVIAYRDVGNSSYGTLIPGTVSGTTISFESAVVFESASTSSTAIAFDNVTNKIVVAYKDVGNSNYSTGVVFQNSSVNTNITAENFIGMSRGAVTSTSYSESLGSSVELKSSSSLFFSATYDSNSKKVILVYGDAANSAYGTAVVGTISGTSVSFGTPVVFVSGEVKGPNSVVFDSSRNVIVVSFIPKTTSSANDRLGRSVTGAVSGTTINFNTAATFHNAVTQNVDSVFDPSTNKVLVVYKDASGSNDGSANVGTLSASGDSISFGSQVDFTTNTTSGISIAADTANDRVVISYHDSSSSVGKSVVGTISGTSVSFGTPVTFNSGNVYTTSTSFDSDTGKVVISYRDNGNSDYGTAIVGTIDSSDNSISFGTEAVFESASVTSMSMAYNSAAQKTIISYLDGGDSNKVKIIEATVSGTAISFGSVVDTTTVSSAGNFKVAFDSTENVIFLPLKDDAVDHTDAYVFRSAYTQITRDQVASGSRAIVDIGSAVSANQLSLTAGQQYFVQTDGTIGLTADDPSVIAGTAVSATDIIVKG